MPEGLDSTEFGNLLPPKDSEFDTQKFNTVIVEINNTQISSDSKQTLESGAKPTPLSVLLNENGPLLAASLTTPDQGVKTLDSLAKLIKDKNHPLSIDEIKTNSFVIDFLLKNSEATLKLLPSLPQEEINAVLLGVTRAGNIHLRDEEKTQICNFLRKGIIETFKNGKNYNDVVKSVSTAIGIANSDLIEQFINDAFDLIGTPYELDDDSNFDKLDESRKSQELAVRILRGVAKLNSDDEHNIQIPEKVSKLLEHFGLPVEKTIDAWNSSYSQLETGNHFLVNIWGYNLEAAIDLEVSQPGITNYLYKNFGILDYYRYPQEMLIKQYKERYDSKSPYGVVIYPREDYNGAFTHHMSFLTMYKNLEALGYNLRVFECSDKLDVVSALNRARHAYGKISFALIGGHGREHDISFGPKDNPNRSLTSEDILRKGSPAVTRAFVDNPTIILASCSTGAEGGIAQEISKLGANVIAPNQDTSFNGMEVHMKEGKLIFEVEYGQENHTSNFNQGEKKN